MTTQRQIALAGWILGAMAVAFGAFGAHGLKSVLTVHSRIENYELAVRYHFYHAFALLGVAALYHHAGERYARWSANLLVLGTLCFSGSLYLLAVLEIRAAVYITPLGGVLLIAGWLAAAWGVLNNKKPFS